MVRLNDQDPFERYLKNVEPEQPPSGVYERLQARASWNRPAPRFPLVPLVVALALATALIVFLVRTPHPDAGRIEPGILAPATPAPLPVIATAPSLPAIAATHPDPDQVGPTLSTLLERETPFSTPFDDSGHRPTLDELLMES